MGRYCISNTPGVFQTSCTRCQQKFWLMRYPYSVYLLYNITQIQHSRNIWILLVVATLLKMGPWLHESSKYYIWRTLPQILSLFSLWLAELWGKPAGAGGRHLPVMRPFPVMYDPTLSVYGTIASAPTPHNVGGFGIYLDPLRLVSKWDRRRKGLIQWKMRIYSEVLFYGFFASPWGQFRYHNLKLRDVNG